MIKTLLFILSVCICALCSKTFSQEKEEQKNLEKAIQNPIANMVSVPFQNNTDFGIGAFDRTKNTLNIQPVLPFTLSKSLNLITRTIIPIITQPTDSVNSVTGLGDITLSTFFSPSKPSALIWGIGPVFSFPTATDDILGSKKWSVGPAIVMLTQPKGWTLGVLAQNTWSYAGDTARGDLNFFYSQIFIVKNLPNGWYVNSAPIITANWKAESGNQWTIPLGFGAGKLVRLGKLPLNLQAGYYYYIEKPDGGPKWQLRTQVTFILPKFY